jgi:hypothetical protein
MRQAQLMLSLPGRKITAMSQMHLSAAGQVSRWEAISSLRREREGGAGAPTEPDVRRTTSTLTEIQASRTMVFHGIHLNGTYGLLGVYAWWHAHNER